MAAALFAACGSDGADGQNGNDGQNGQNGSDGQNGTNAAVNTTIEPAGENCANGGIKIEVLEDGVVQSGKTQFICNGAAGEQGGPGSAGTNGFNTAVRTTEIEAGATCANGGYKVEMGLDKNGNGKLDDDEVTGDAETICNGSAGTNGVNTAIRATKIEAGETCINGGYKIETGLDKNGNGKLDDDEVTGDPETICNGSAGFNAAIRMTEINEGDETCINGGYKIETGLDKDGNHKLDDGEVQAELTQTICNGENGDAGLNGTNGLNAIVGAIYIPVYDGCTYGANKVSFGIDLNGNGTLDEADDETNEVNFSQAFCADACGEGYGYLESAQKCLPIRESEESKGENCQYGGTKVEYLGDDGEVVGTGYLCIGICTGEDEIYSESAGKCVSKTWAEIPAGHITVTHMGIDKDVPSFLMMRTEVTVEAFKACVEATQCSSENFAVFDANDTSTSSENSKKYCNYGRGDDWNDHPMNCVNSAGAKAFCASIGGRVPKNYEWVYAAFHDPQNPEVPVTPYKRYAWGTEISVDTHCVNSNYMQTNDPAGIYCNGNERTNTVVGTAPVGSYPAGATPLGLLDMSGNVSEWALDESGGSRDFIYSDSYEDHNWALNNWSQGNSETKKPVVGFRCIKDPAPSNDDANP